MEDETRTFLEDGDGVTLKGFAEKNGIRVGFGECKGKILPAHPETLYKWLFIFNKKKLNKF